MPKQDRQQNKHRSGKSDTRADVKVEVTGQSWRLTVLPRSFGSGLFYLGVSLIPGWIVGYFLLSFLRNNDFGFLMATLLPGAMLLFFGHAALQRLLGKIVVSCEGKQGTIFTGFGIIGRRQTFDWSGMQRIEDVVLVPASHLGEIVFDGATRIRFGQILIPDQRQAVVQELRQLLKKADLREATQVTTDDQQPTHRSISLNVSDQGWCLKVSQRSPIEGLLSFVIAMILAVGVACFSFNALTVVGQTPRVIWGSLTVAVSMLIMLILAASYAAYCLFGTIIISVEENLGTVFVGVGNVGHRQRFDWSQVTTIDDQHVVLPKLNYIEIVLSGSKQIHFGNRLSESQRIEVLRLLRSLLKQKQRQQNLK